MSVKENAAHFFKQLESAQSDQLRQRALRSPRQFITLARKQGYKLGFSNFAEQVANLSEETIAAIFAPGVGTRRHLIRR